MAIKELKYLITKDKIQLTNTTNCKNDLLFTNKSVSILTKKKELKYIFELIEFIKN